MQELRNSPRINTNNQWMSENTQFTSFQFMTRRSRYWRIRTMLRQRKTTWLTVETKQMQCSNHSRWRGKYWAWNAKPADRHRRGTHCHRCASTQGITSKLWIMFRLVALVNYSQKPCLKTDTMNNRSHGLWITTDLSVEITTKMCDTYINFHKVRWKQDRSFKPHT